VVKTTSLKSKVIPVLNYVITHHTMKAYGGRGYVATIFLTLALKYLFNKI
jgi:hypothetical protein